MLEVARRLSESGERVALLAFLDTYPHPRHWPLRCWTDFIARRLRHHISALPNLPLRDALPRLLELCRGLLDHLRSRRGGSSERGRKANGSAGIPSALEQLRQSAIEACAQYTPCSYRGKLTFLRAEIASTFPVDPTKIWGNLVSQIEIHNMHCNHVGMITTHAEGVAAELSLCLENALSSKIPTNWTSFEALG